ncbi:MAG: acyl--CoA ligase [Alphaproteobacteria bacterium]|nr:acyl--CoA ligase [Alphaproteobacteria bacterium]
MAARPGDVLDALARGREALERETLPASIGALFDAAVARHGDRPLWVPVDGGAGLTYRQMAAAVARCTAALHALGVGAGTHVATMLPSVPALAITWMALARLGAVMLPVNTRYTARELDHVLAEGDAELLVVDAAHRGLIERADGGVLPLPRARIVMVGGTASGIAGEWRALLDAAGTVPPLPAVDPDRLMTLQFTSGSTGAPKGCMLPHRYWTMIGRVRALQAPRVDRMLIDMPFHYMGGQWRFLMALYQGATAHVARQPSLTRLIDTLLAHDIQFCSVTPALAKQPLDPRRERLRLTWAGTMALPRELHAPLEERLGGAPVREMYGLTETGAALAMPHAVDWMTGSGSCGLPVPFRRLRIVDADGNEVPVGAAGELWIGGPGMMQGYYGRPDATAEAFHDGWFRTGDLFRRDADGFHTVLGRIKDVIRRSGENISATEVEGVLSTLPEIVEVAAIPVPDDMRGEEVKVCLALRPGLSAADLPPERVLDHCRERLARFKLPRYIAYLPELPKTPSGKIAKQALRPPHEDLRLGSFDVVDGVWR